MKLTEIEHEIEMLENRKLELAEMIKMTVHNAITQAVNEQQINRVSEHIVIIKSSSLIGRPWSASYHNWNGCAKILIEYLEKIPVLKWRETIQKLYEKRKDPNRIDIPVKRKHFLGYYSTVIEPIAPEFVEIILKMI